MGVKISNLPVIVTPALSDIFPVVQSGITYKETFTQLTSLLATAGANSNITSLSGLSTPLSIAQGGTGSATGNPTFASVTFNPTTGGIVGTTTNDNAAAGKVGELIESIVLGGAAVAVTTATASDITSISLTAGDWNVWGQVQTLPAGGTTTTQIIGWTSATSATLPTPPNKGSFNQLAGISLAAGNGAGIPIGIQRLSLSGTTTVYLSCSVTFAVSTMGVYGYIGARRVR